MVKTILNELMGRWEWSKNVDRIGPDILYSHILSYAPNLFKRYCESKFGQFSEGAEIRPGAYAVNCSNIFIGKNVVIRPNTMLMAADGECGKITIEDNVLIGSGVHFYVSNHTFSNPTIEIYYQGHDEPRPITLEKGCWIGANAIILPGVTIGKNAVVAAGAVVTKNVESATVVGGVPAKVVRRVGE